MSRTKTLILITVFALLVFCTYSIMQDDDYQFSVQQKVSVDVDVVFQNVQNLQTWPDWAATGDQHVEYQIDTQVANPILRWESNTTAMSGYRELRGVTERADVYELRFKVLDASGAEFQETLQIETVNGDTVVRWLVEGDSDDFVEKLMRPVVIWMLQSQYEQYLGQLDAILVGEAS